MSHEGIRIVNAEDAQAQDHNERKLPQDSVTPLKVRVKKTEGTGVEIHWRDGHTSSWTFPWLRLACPCATCHEEREKDGRLPGQSKPKPKALLVMYEPPVKPLEVSSVGKYAIKFKWSDGHESGIYSWDYLRRVCRCPACTPLENLNV
jgi:DUF971 family protein